MKRLSPRTARLLACAAALLAASACSGNDPTPPLPPEGPVSVEIRSITLGEGTVEEGEQYSRLGCDYQIGVVLEIGSGWNLQPPGFCATTQCGQVRVTLSGPDHRDVVQRLGTTSALELNAKQSLAKPGVARGEFETYSLRAELVDDSGQQFTMLGATTVAEQSFRMALPDECPDESDGAAGAQN